VKLIRLEGSAALDDFDIEGPQAIIGRAPDCDVILFDPQASRRHARLRRDGSSFVIEDIQELNPSIVNDRVLTGTRRLVDGDLIVVGGVVLMVDEDDPVQISAPAGGSLPPGSGAIQADPRTASADGEAVEEGPTDRAGSTTQPKISAQSRPESEQQAPPPPSPADACRNAARRLDAGARRLQARATTLREHEPSAWIADVAAMDDLLSSHERLGGDETLARVAALLQERLSNQTDIRALYRLGAETQALADWTGLARQSIDEVSRLASSLDLR